ncbi:MAG: CT583 family protein [Chlamydiales bacterium]|nr:CT583 family protein [Chlamydiales bacterium]
MAKLAELLQQRFKKKEKAKMSALAEKSHAGDLAAFSGVFQVNDISPEERKDLRDILEKYEEERSDTTEDLQQLSQITSEVKAINNQAAILHGERIKRAQQLLKKYKEGAFTAWLLATYGNRQTPYNFLQYFEFHSQMPKALHPKIEKMPRQAIYTLASREGTLEQKEEVVRNYKGETKQEVITQIRTLFPLNETDKRRENIPEMGIKMLRRVIAQFERPGVEFTPPQKKRLAALLKKIMTYTED